MIPIIILVFASVATCQRGNYVRPLDYRFGPSYRAIPVLHEISYLEPRTYRPVYRPEEVASRIQGRAQAQAQAQERSLPHLRRSEVEEKKSEILKEEEQPATESTNSLEPNSRSILSYSNEMSQDGAYAYKYETADGVMKEESATMELSEEGIPVKKVRGSYSYPSPDGRIIRVEYVADEGGFRANQIDEPSTSFRRSGSSGFSYSFRAP